MALAQERVLAPCLDYLYRLPAVHLARQRTGAGTAFPRWRKPDRSVMSVALWRELIASPCIPAHLLGDLYAMENQRLVLNMQVSLLHTLGRQALECAGKPGVVP
jgi:hypothetical protein